MIPARIRAAAVVRARVMAKVMARVMARVMASAAALIAALIPLTTPAAAADGHGPAATPGSIVQRTGEAGRPAGALRPRADRPRRAQRAFMWSPTFGRSGWTSGPK